MTSKNDDRSSEVVLRVPAWQTAAVLLVASLAAAAAIYTHLNTGARVFCSLLAIAFGMAGLISGRAYLVADSVGIGLRRVFSEHSIPWSEVSSVEVIVRKNQPMVYIFCDGAKPARVPGYLTLPLKPATGYTAARRLESLVARIMGARPSR